MDNPALIAQAVYLGTLDAQSKAITTPSPTEAALREALKLALANIKHAKERTLGSKYGKQVIDEVVDDITAALALPPTQQGSADNGK